MRNLLSFTLPRARLPSPSPSLLPPHSVTLRSFQMCLIHFLSISFSLYLNSLVLFLSSLPPVNILFSSRGTALTRCPPPVWLSNLKVCCGLLCRVSEASEIGFTCHTLTVVSCCLFPPCLSVSAGADGCLCCRITAHSALCECRRR